MVFFPRLHRFALPGKDLHQSVQLGVLDGSVVIPASRQDFLLRCLVGLDHCPCSEVRGRYCSLAPESWMGLLPGLHIQAGLLYELLCWAGLLSLLF